MKTSPSRRNRWIAAVAATAVVGAVVPWGPGGGNGQAALGVQVNVTAMVMPAALAGWSLEITAGSDSETATKGSPTVTFYVMPDTNVTIGQNLPTDWVPGGIVCDGFGGATINAPVDSTVTCTAYSYAPPVVTLSKLSNGGIGSFGFLVYPGTGDPQTDNWGGQHNLSTTVAGVPSTPVPVSVDAGPVNIKEVALTSGFWPDGMACTLVDVEGTPAQQPVISEGSAAVTFPDVAAGEEVQCLQTNNAGATVQVTKTVYPAGLDWEVDFTINATSDDLLGQDATLTATDENPTVSWTNLPPGKTYTIWEEAPPAGWSSESFSCSVIGGPSRVPHNRQPAPPSIPSAQTTPDPGAIIGCDAINYGPPMVTVTKSVMPAGLPDWSVDFNISPDPDGAGGQDDTKTATPGSPSVVWTGLTPGVTYTIQEVNLSSNLTEGIIECATTPAGGGQGSSGGFGFEPELGDEVLCSVTNVGDPIVTFSKVTQDGVGGPFTFEVRAESDGSLIGSTTATTTQANTSTPAASVISVPSGTSFTISESSTAPGWFSGGSMSCTYVDGSGAPVTEFLVGPDDPQTLSGGESLHCEQTNVPAASVSVTKTVEGATDWSVPFKISPDPDGAGGQDDTKTATDENPTVSWSGLDPNQNYDIREVLSPGSWKSAGFDCGSFEVTPGPSNPGDAADPVRIDPTPGTNVPCTIGNVALASVTVTKTVDGPTPWSGFQFEISPVPAGQDAVKTASSANPAVTWTGLDPETPYTVEELLPTTGYFNGPLVCIAEEDHSTGPGRPTHSPANGGPVGPSDTFNPVPGEHVQCTIENRTQGSIQLTKSVVGAGPNDVWEFEFTLNPGGVKKTVSNASPTATWTGLDPDVNYTVVESPSTDENYAPGTITCGAVSGPGLTGVVVDVPAGGTANCTATNSDLRVTDLALTKSVTGLAELAGNVVWTITVSNVSLTAAANVVLNDTLPTELDLIKVEAPAGWSCAGSTPGVPAVVNCTKPTMAPGETATFSVETSVRFLEATEIVNTAVVGTSTKEITLTNNVDDAKIEAAELPATGANSSGLLLAGVGALGVGFALWILGRRRPALVRVSRR